MEQRPSEDRILHVIMPSRGYMSMPTHVFLANFNIWANRANFGRVEQHLPTGMSAVQAREEGAMIVDQWRAQMPDKEHWVLWLDDDMDPPVNAVAAFRTQIVASEQTEHPIGILSGFCSRKEQFDPGLMFARKTKEHMLPLVDYTPGEIVEVEWCGLAFAMHRAEWLDKVPQPRFAGNWGGAQEDHDFTIALRNVGCIPYVHSGIAVGHYQVERQHTFFPYTPVPVRSNGKVEVTP